MLFDSLTWNNGESGLQLSQYIVSKKAGSSQIIYKSKAPLFLFAVCWESSLCLISYHTDGSIVK